MKECAYQSWLRNSKPFGSSSGRKNSALTQLRVLKANGWTDLPFLCIDPWISDLAALLARNFRTNWTDSSWRVLDGHTMNYWQFMLNIQSAIQHGEISSTHVVPLHSTSPVGGR